MLIAGSFREYPFFLLLDIFLRRRETGLLEVSSTEESGYFYIKNGKVKDGQVGKNKGLAAVALAGKLNDGSFQFKPLAPSDYARVVWQHRFGPKGPANDESPISVLAARNTISQFVSRAAAAYRVSNALAYSTQRAVRQILVYTSVALHGIQTIAVSLARRCVVGGFTFWKRAQVGTRLLRILKKVSAVRQDKRRRDRHLTSRYPRKVTFQLPSPTVRDGTAITGALKEGVERVVFVFIMTLLLGVGAVMLYQLASGDEDLRDAGIDEHFDIPVNASQTRAKPKQHGSKRLPGGASRDK